MQLITMSSRNKNSMDDNMIPLINIVFLMLIFFMVAGQIMQSDPVKVTLPSSVSEKHKTEEPIVLVISNTGAIAFDRQPITKDLFPQRLADHFEQYGAKEKYSLLVKVDADLAVEELREVLSMIKQTGIKRVSLATQQLVKNDDS